jgi:hypothetical protein
VGMLYDYFRCADTSAVIELMQRTDGGPVAVGGLEQVVDAVDAKGINPDLALAQLIGLVIDAPPVVGLVKTTLVWPAGVEDDPDYEGPWVEAIDDGTRDVLAAVPDPRIPELAARWGRTEELPEYEELAPDTLASVLTDLVALARRARAAHEHVYCWESL